MAGRHLQSADALLLPAVAETLDALTIGPEDAAIARLARRYAAQIDEAARIAAALAEIDPDDDINRVLVALTGRVRAQSVLAELGPKLQAALVELGASPRARSGMKGGVPAGNEDDSPLARLRRSRPA